METIFSILFANGGSREIERNDREYTDSRAQREVTTDRHETPRRYNIVTLFVVLRFITIRSRTERSIRRGAHRRDDSAFVS